MGVVRVEQFLHCGLRKFRHSKSSVDRWYKQLDRRRFVYDTCKTMKASRTRHGWVHMLTTHRPTLTLQLHNFDLFRTCRTALLRGNWQDFNWYDASRGPSAIAELLVTGRMLFLTTNQQYKSTEDRWCDVSCVTIVCICLTYHSYPWLPKVSKRIGICTFMSRLQQITT